MALWCLLALATPASALARPRCKTQFVRHANLDNERPGRAYEFWFDYFKAKGSYLNGDGQKQVWAMARAKSTAKVLSIHFPVKDHGKCKTGSGGQYSVFVWVE